jgi:hypothetical protein
MLTMGRLTEYTPELAKEICSRISTGESLRSICAPDYMPAVSTVCLWNLEDRNGFAEQYARARKAQAELLADELLDIADDGSNDFMETKHGPVVDQENINRSRLRVDTRKWYLSKVLPKIYGDKLIHQGDETQPLVVKHIGKVSE